MKRTKPKPRKRAACPDPLRRALSVYFAVQILLLGAFLLPAGLSLAADGAERVWKGGAAERMRMEDLNKTVRDIQRGLYVYTNMIREALKEKNTIDKNSE